MSAGFVLGEGEADPVELVGVARRLKVREHRRCVVVALLAGAQGGGHLTHRIRGGTMKGTAPDKNRRAGGHDFAPKYRRRRSATVSASLASPGSSLGTAA